MSSLLCERSKRLKSQENKQNVQEMQGCQQDNNYTVPLKIVPDCLLLLPMQHHCRKCGAVVCGACSNRRFLLPYQAMKPLRVCISCYDALTTSQAERERTAERSVLEAIKVKCRGQRSVCRISIQLIVGKGILTCT